MRKAIFLDRDGTVIVDKHYQYCPKSIEYFNDTFNSLKELQKNGFDLVLITNQSGIGRGKFTVDQMHDLHKQMNQDLESHGLDPFLDIFYCPHAPEENCECRKPGPVMILRACEKWNIDPTQSYMIGDKDIDVEAGTKAGVKSFKVDYKKKETLSNILSKIIC
ncbi:MAG: HAD family hydrolase [Halobacteriovoraceae bacterium]|nr:HAD family hydrolase [Halobacteriovoraceae bacterium]